MIGKSLSHYAITGKLGEGGMGEVWRASDTKLRREVAIKLLPPEFTQDPERLARFEREAQLLAQLHHPHIASIFGLEEEDGVRGLVMELVEGPTLDQRLQSGALSLEESLAIARQIAEALEVAHAKGIIHRDLKPQNIKASTDGMVKVLDFGLAKALDPDPGVSADDAATRMADSPTISAAATAQGIILGTASYMSPEQARGARVDKRSDIWAFGVVLYEMLAGTELFEGDTVSDRLAGVLKSQIDLGKLPADTPPAIRRLLRRCLERNPKSRLHDIADARIVLDEVLAGQVDDFAPIAPGTAGSRWLRALPWTLVVILLAAWLTQVAGGRGETDETPSAPRALEISVPRGNLLADDTPPVLSPDGSMIVFGAADPLHGVHLWLRRLDRFESIRLQGTDGASHPFWSPDSKSIGFFRSNDGTMNRYDLPTAVSRVVIQMGSGGGRGGSWGSDDDILFSRSANAPIERVSADGGEPVVVTQLDPEILDGSHRFPIHLPDGEHFLFTLWSNHLETASRVGGIYLASFDQGILRRIAPDVCQAVLVGNDRLLVRRDRSLVALHFDPENFEIVGSGAPIVKDPLFALHSGALGATASGRGDIAFALAAGEGSGQLVWLDRDGQSIGSIGNERLAIHRLAPAPDGRRFAVQVHTSTGSNIWVGDERRQVLSRLTPVGLDSQYPVWSPNSDRVAYSSAHTGSESIYVQEADGSRQAELLLSANDRDFRPTDWSADGRFLILESDRKISARSDLWVYDFEQGDARELLSGGSASIREGRISHDGRWIAYSSDESGNPEIFVRPFPGLDGKWKLSQGGGSDPHWSRDGGELFFIAIADHSLQSISVRTDGDELEAEIAQRVFTPRSPLLALAPAPDHTKLLAGVVPGDVRSEPIHMIVGWQRAANAP